jgi:hypothetical protein
MWVTAIARPVTIVVGSAGVGAIVAEAEESRPDRRPRHLADRAGATGGKPCDAGDLRRRADRAAALSVAACGATGAAVASPEAPCGVATNVLPSSDTSSVWRCSSLAEMSVPKIGSIHFTALSPAAVEEASESRPPGNSGAAIITSRPS